MSRQVPWLQSQAWCDPRVAGNIDQELADKMTDDIASPFISFPRSISMLSLLPSVVSLWSIVASLAFAVMLKLIRTERRCLPPGPPRLPILGNILDVPTTDMESTFRDMNNKYGDVVYLDALGQPMIILGTHEAAIDLLEKRSANYSDRIPSTMARLCGLDWVLTLIPYGPWWRRHRRAFHQFFNPNVILQYRPSQRLEAHRFVNRLMDDPKNFVHHIRFLFGSTIMRVAYGIEVSNGNEGYLDMAESALKVFSDASVPGRYLVETFPSLRHVPSWTPGAQFKRDAIAWTPIVQALLKKPWETALNAIRTKNAPPSMASALMESISQMNPSEAAEEEEIARNICAVAYGGGADTTLSTIQSFFLAMASFPEAQRRAQEELDAVIGPDRLPDFDDGDSLPYVSALIKECLRWRSVVPLAVPHRSLEDDEYCGYFIPKGSIVIPNIWAYSRDPLVYDEPETFKPERFLKDGQLNPEVRDPATIAFGYGRRICPGRYFAESSLFMIVSTVLHTLSISSPVNDEGKPMKLEGKMTQGLLSYPESFDCIIKSRSTSAEELIHASCSMVGGAPADRVPEDVL